MPPTVQLTSLLRQALLAEGFDPDEFAQYFADWKALGDAGEYLDYYFGKDGFYDHPRRHGRRVLRHVHLPPADERMSGTEAPSPALARWEQSWKRRGRKTSDTALIYAEAPAWGYLLIYIAREPQGQELAQMATVATKTFMNQLADVAERFVFNGSIII